MSKRRSISVRGDTYDRLLTYSNKLGKSTSQIVEELLQPVIGSTPPTKHRNVRGVAPGPSEQYTGRSNRVAAGLSVSSPRPNHAPPAPPAPKGGTDAPGGGRPAPRKLDLEQRQPSSVVLL